MAPASREECPWQIARKNFDFTTHLEKMEEAPAPRWGTGGKIETFTVRMHFAPFTVSFIL
jgi:hypothetical protein